MSDFCDFVPDDPSCVSPDPEPQPGPTKTTPEEKIDEEKEIDSEMESAMMQANVTYLLTALSLTVHAALVQFRYRNVTDYYSAGDALSQNYWQLLNNVWNFFTIGFMGIATITQLLSMLGLFAEINVMVWMYGGMLDMVISLVTSLVAMYAYDAYWSESQASTSNSADAATALSNLESDMLAMTAYSTAAGVNLWMHSEAWMMAQFMALPEETQEKWMAEKEGKVEDMDEKEMLAMMLRF